MVQYFWSLLYLSKFTNSKLVTFIEHLIVSGTSEEFHLCVRI